MEGMERNQVCCHYYFSFRCCWLSYSKKWSCYTPSMNKWCSNHKFFIKNWFGRNDKCTFHNFNFLSSANGFTHNGAQHSNEAEDVEGTVFFNITPKMSWLVRFVIEIGNNTKRRCFFLMLSYFGAVEIIEAASRRATGNFCWRNICSCLVIMKTSRQRVHFFPHNLSILEFLWTQPSQFNFSRHSGSPVV